MLELDRIDLITEVSTLSSHLALPRRGHLDALLHMFRYLKDNHNARVVLDPTIPEIDESNFPEHDCSDIYGDVKEAIPPDAPGPRGRSVNIRAFVDSDHANDKVTRRSRTGSISSLTLPLSFGSLRSSLPFRHLSLCKANRLNIMTRVE
jgi:hypothetical protein